MPSLGSEGRLDHREQGHDVSIASSPSGSLIGGVWFLEDCADNGQIGSIVADAIESWICSDPWQLRLFSHEGFA